MRTLTLKRENSTVARHTKFFVFIEDSHLATAEIDGVKVRPIGYIRNGESVTYTVADHEARFFVVYGQVGLSFVAESVTIPEGDTPLYLIGYAANTATYGSRFVFRNVTAAVTTDGRNKARKRKQSVKTALGITLIVLFCLLYSISYGIGVAAIEYASNDLFLFDPVTYQTVTYKELSLELPKDAKETSPNSYEFDLLPSYGKAQFSPPASVRFRFTSYEKVTLDEATLTDYALSVMKDEIGQKLPENIVTEDGLIYFDDSRSRIYFYESESRYYVIYLTYSINDSRVPFETVQEIRSHTASSVTVTNNPDWTPKPAVPTDFVFKDLTLTLDSYYTEAQGPDEAIFQSYKYAVQINRFAVSEQGEDVKTPSDFAWQIIKERPESYAVRTRVGTDENGLLSFELRSTDQTPITFCDVYVYEHEGYYYTVAIYTHKTRYLDNLEYITEIAQSVRFE